MILNKSVKLCLCFFLLFLLAPSFSFCQDIEKEYPGQRILFRVGYQTDTFSDLSLKDAEVAIQLWVNNINVKKKLDAKIIFLDDFDSSLKAIINKSVELIALMTTDYLKIEDKGLLEPARKG